MEQVFYQLFWSGACLVIIGATALVLYLLYLFFFLFKSMTDTLKSTNAVTEGYVASLYKERIENSGNFAEPDEWFPELHQIQTYDSYEQEGGEIHHFITATKVIPERARKVDIDGVMFRIGGMTYETGKLALIWDEEKGEDLLHTMKILRPGKVIIYIDQNGEDLS